MANRGAVEQRVRRLHHCVLQLERLEDPFLDEGIPALSEEPLSQIARQHRTRVAVRQLGAGRVDLALSRDARDDVLDPFCVRSGKVLPIDAAGVSAARPRRKNRISP
jgi:hypothetical protein